MNFNINTLAIVSGFALSLAAAPSLAQVAPPPTSPAEKEPEYKPAPKQTPKAAPQQAAPKPKTQSSGQSTYGGRDATLPLDIPYPKLIIKDSNGIVLRLRQLPDIAALRSNPTVGPSSVDKMMPFVIARHNRFEHKVINNLDLYWALTGGLINSLDMGNLNDLGKVTKMLKPLVGKLTFTQEMMNNNILTRVQGGFNKHIINEYKKAITDQIQVIDGENGLGSVMKFVLNDSLLETNLVYTDMLGEIMPNVSNLVDQANLSSPEALALKEYQKSLNTDDAKQQMFDLQDFDVEFRKLTFEEGISLLEAMRANRDDSDVSPMVKHIEVLHAGKSLQESGNNVKILRKDEIKKSGNKIKNEKKLNDD